MKNLDVSHEQTLLSFGDAKHTPRRRALALGLTLDAYLAAVYLAAVYPNRTPARWRAYGLLPPTA